jgi:hypothetical protein
LTRVYSSSVLKPFICTSQPSQPRPLPTPPFQLLNDVTRSPSPRHKSQGQPPTIPPIIEPPRIQTDDIQPLYLSPLRCERLRRPRADIRAPIRERDAGLDFQRVIGASGSRRAADAGRRRSGFVPRGGRRGAESAGSETGVWRAHGACGARGGCGDSRSNSLKESPAKCNHHTKL